MERQRVRDRLVGAAVAVAVLVVVVVVAVLGLLWWVSEPAGSDPARAAGRATPGAGSDAAGRADPPDDLADGETWLGDLVLDAGTVVTAGSQLRDVRAVGGDVRTGPDGVVAGTLAVEATVPFDVVADQLGDDLTVRRGPGSQATVERTVRFGGRELRVVATGTVDVEAGRLVVEPRSVDVGGPDVLSDAIGGLARRLVTIEHEVEGLPDGLVLRDVTVQDDGFRARLDGTDVLVAQ